MLYNVWNCLTCVKSLSCIGMSSRLSIFFLIIRSFLAILFSRMIRSTSHHIDLTIFLTTRWLLKNLFYIPWDSRSVL